MTKLKINKWDVQHHVVPEFYVSELKKIGITDAAGVPFPKWTYKKSLKVMNAWNINKSILSLSLPGVHFGDDKKACLLASKTNDWILDLMQSHPERFGGFASLPLPDVDGSLIEYQRSIVERGMNGVILMSNVGGIYPGNASYRPLFEKFDRDRTIVFIHPNTSPETKDCGLLNPFYFWFLDTTKALLSLLNSGFHRDYPNIRYIFAHGGGALARFSQELEEADPILASELREWRQQIFFDTAKFVNNEALSSLLDFTDDTHIMFSSDFPWASASKMRYWTSRLNENFMNNVTLERIYFKNAKNLFSKEDGLEPLNKIDLVEKRKPVHMHAMPVTLKDEIESLAIDISKVNWFDFEQLENKFLKEDYPLRITLDLPELWDKEQSLIDKFISQYNREIGILSEKHKNIFQAFGAIDLASSGCISQIESCILNSNIEGLCLFPPDDYDIKNLKPQVINLLSSLVIPVMIHPRDSRGTIIFNENKLAVPKFMAQIMYSGEIDKLTNLSFILTHTSGIHRDLIDSMGMLFYLRKDGWKMVRFIFDYFFRRKLKGEAILNDAIWD